MEIIYLREPSLTVSKVAGQNAEDDTDGNETDGVPVGFGLKCMDENNWECICDIVKKEFVRTALVTTRY